MTDLKEYIEDLLEIPCIEENKAVMDGSFIITPYLADSLLGNGEATCMTLRSAVNLFYTNKTDAIENGITLYKALLGEYNCACDSPDFVFENEAQIWHVVLRVQEVINE